MPRIGQVLATITLLFGSAVERATADEVSAIVDRAIQAHGIKVQDAKDVAYRGKNKGVLHVGGMKLEFNQEATFQGPNKFKEVLEISVMDQKVPIVTIFNGKEGWMKVNGMDFKVDKDLLAEFEAAARMTQLSQSLLLKDKTIKLSPLGEIQVNDKPALGVKVSAEGKKELDLYFDKATGLMAKTERRSRDYQSGQEVTEERIITEYQTLKGRKVAKKVQMKRDGKDFLDLEVVEANFPEHIDEGEFAKP